MFLEEIDDLRDWLYDCGPEWGAIDRIAVALNRKGG
jgi:hypothetical protein